MAAPRQDAAVLALVHSTRATLASWRSRHDAEVEENRLALAYAIEAKEPMRAARLHSALAAAFVGLGQADSALWHAQQGVDMARRLYAPDHRSLATALGRLAEVQVSRERFAEALAAQEEAVRILRGKGGPGEHLAYELAVLANIHHQAGDLGAAIRRTEEALGMYRAVYGPAHHRVGETMSNLANYQVEAGRVVTADTLFRGSIAILEALNDRSVILPLARLNYAHLCLSKERLAEADRQFAGAWAGLDSSNAAMRAWCGDVLLGRARVRAWQGRSAEAESLAALGLRLRRGERAEQDPDLLDVWLDVAEVRWLGGRAADAIEMLGRARRSGATAADVARYPKLRAARTRPGYPFVSSP